MHIEPEVVNGAKIILSYATLSVSAGLLIKSALELIKKVGASSFALRSVIATLLVLVFFQVFPHFSVGVSEVHLILGATLFLILGVAPAALGLAAGLMLQGLIFSPIDLPQFGMNMTTLLIPLFGLSVLANRVLPEQRSYIDMRYSEAFQLSLIYQGGIVAWVGFWALYGQGFSVVNLTNIASFSMAYLGVIAIEPLLSVAVLAGAKSLHKNNVIPRNKLLNERLFHLA